MRAIIYLVTNKPSVKYSRIDQPASADRGGIHLSHVTWPGHGQSRSNQAGQDDEDMAEQEIWGSKGVHLSSRPRRGGSRAKPLMPTGARAGLARPAGDARR